LIARPYDVEYGTVKNAKLIQYKVTNAKKSPEMELTESVYNKLKEILKRSGSGNTANSLEKSFDFLTFEISRLKENFNENLESRFGQLNNETGSISRDIESKTNNLNIKLNEFQEQLDTRTTSISNEIANIKNVSSKTSDKPIKDLTSLGQQIETLKKDVGNLKKVIEFFKDYTWVPAIDHKCEHNNFN
jgi:methyl-accepting chemotaxis protein